MPKSSKVYFFFLSLVLAIIGCGAPPSVSAPRDRGLPVAVTPTIANEFYKQMGLLAAPPPVSLVGKTAFYATRFPDTTLVLTSISLPNRALTFSREGDRYSAPYEVHIRITRGDVEAASLNALEVVRVGTFKEVNRSDESVIFQHFFRLPPGRYGLSVVMRDVGGARMTSQDARLLVPRISPTGLSTPLLTYEVTPRAVLDSAPRLLASPRSTAVFGRDSLVSVFLEAYGGTGAPINYVVTNEAQERMFADSATLPRTGSLFSGTVQIPISSVGLGITKLSFVRRGTADTASIPIFVSFGEDVPIMSFANMIEYLRFFAPEWRLKTLRGATPAQRASVWAAFFRDTDPIPETPVNEALESYFARIRQANVQFLNDRNPGWLSDRGVVFVALGEPTLIMDRNVNQGTGMQAGGSTRVQVWTYQQYHTQLFFYEDVGHWRLTRASENEFWAINSRRLSR
ncbi:MAG: GWxTD domain-containing protein [Gemmatimonadaceae bacterium]|nr:GWxTD domain-containing protein [Gemmatimonadaceae bacterium]